LLPTVVQLEQLTLLGFLEIVLTIAVVLPLTLGSYVILADRARRMFKSATAVRRINRGTGAAMACAAVAVATR
jgi:threonine/homoserine/homoserine lactone efflux protein